MFFAIKLYARWKSKWKFEITSASFERNFRLKSKRSIENEILQKEATLSFPPNSRILKNTKLNTDIKIEPIPFADLHFHARIYHNQYPQRHHNCQRIKYKPRDRTAYPCSPNKSFAGLQHFRTRVEVMFNNRTIHPVIIIIHEYAYEFEGQVKGVERFI